MSNYQKHKYCEKCNKTTLHYFYDLGIGREFKSECTVCRFGNTTAKLESLSVQDVVEIGNTNPNFASKFDE